MHSSPRKWMRVFQLCSLKIKSSRFLKRLLMLGSWWKLLSMVLKYCPRCSFILFLSSFVLFKRNLLLNQAVLSFQLIRNEFKQAQSNIFNSSYSLGENKKKKKNIHSHLVTSRKWSSSTLKTEQYQYPRSASLIPSKQAVIGMLAVIFHVRLLISPLCSLIILSKHLNNVHDAAVKRVSYSPYAH